MANPAPTINQINAFNATQGTTIDFNIIGGTELVRSNRIYIYDLSDNSLICTHLYVSTESIHELPANTDGSIVYESGKSSADFVNGAQYYAQIQTFTDIGGTEGGSGLSVAKMFWCLVDPTLTIDTIPSTISTTSYNVSATYNTNTSVVSNIIQQYQFSLYSATGSLLQSSGVVVGNGEQQGTSTSYDISYNFSGLSVGSSYYVVVDVTTTQGMSITTQSGTFTVSIDTPTLGEATVVNNACDGYISVTSNLSSGYEYEESAEAGEIMSFTTDSVNDITELDVDFSPVQDDTPWMSTQDKEPYMFRAVPTQTEDFGHESDCVVGGTVVRNQLSTLISSAVTVSDVTITPNNDGSVTLNGTTSSSGVLSGFEKVNVVSGHKYYIRATGSAITAGASVYTPIGGNYANTEMIRNATSTGQAVVQLRANNGVSFTNDKVWVNTFDLTQMFGSTIADYVYTLESGTAGAGVAWLRANAPQLFEYHEFDAGSLESVSGLTSHDMVGFNQWDEEWVKGTYNNKGVITSSTQYMCCKNLIPVVPNAKYHFKSPNALFEILKYDADGNYISRLTYSAKNSNYTMPNNVHYITFGSAIADAYTEYTKGDICINLSNASLNGTYKPYVKHSYPLDNTLTLRGIPKLDASNKLYYDGDTYESDGDVTRKYAYISLDDITYWQSGNVNSNSGMVRFVSSAVKAAGISNVISDRFITKQSTVGFDVDTFESISGYGSGNAIYVVMLASRLTGDLSTQDARNTAFMNWLADNPTHAVYEVITPTTESADPYTNPQIVDPSGTEEYVGSSIPVGHETTYQRICPIDGWSFVNVTRTGKNLIDNDNVIVTYAPYSSMTFDKATLIKKGTYTASISDIANATSWRLGFKFFEADGSIIYNAKSNGVVTFSNTVSGDVLADTYNGNAVCMQSANYTDESVLVTLTKDVYMVCCVGFGDVSNSTTLDYQFEVGNSASTYEPYNSTTYTSTFPKYKQQVTQDTTPYITKDIGDTYADTLTENLVGGTVAWNQSVPDTTTTHTVSGSIASMDDAVAGNFASVVCDIEPVQNGTPWMASTLDVTPYLFRKSGNGNVGNDFNSEIDTLVGGSVVWNQLYQYGDFSQVGTWSANNTNWGAVTVSNGEGILTVGNSTGVSLYLSCDVSAIPSGHVLLEMIDIKSPVNNSAEFLYSGVATGMHWVQLTANTYTKFANIVKVTTERKSVYTYINGDDAVQTGDEYRFKNAMLFDLTQLFGSTIADYIYTLETNNAGDGVAWFKSLFPKPYYAYNVGEIMSVKVASHDTVGFNQCDEEFELGAIDDYGDNSYSINSLRTKNYIPVLPNTNYYIEWIGHQTTESTQLRLYYYDANKQFIEKTTWFNYAIRTTPSNARYIRLKMASGYGTTYNHDICINLSNASLNGTYKPYVKYSYPLDSDLTLRGIPKLDANNKLYYDGDEYTPNGNVARNYGIIDLGTKNWTYYTSESAFYCEINDMERANDNLLCSKYVLNHTGVGNITDGEFTNQSGITTTLWFKNSAYTDAATFKTAMSGVYLVYEKTTPTSETADTFTSPQTVVNDGTEEYIDYAESQGTRDVAVPVGHSTQYANIIPITGWSAVNVTRTGKNLFDGTLSNGYYDVADGSFVSSSSWRSTNKIKCNPSTQYVFSGSSYSSGGYNGAVLFWDANDNYINYQGSGATFTTPNNARYMAFYFGAAYVTAVIQIEQGSTATTYEAYTGTTYTTSLGSTYYGGTLDMVSGVFTVTHGYVDLGTLTWAYNSSVKFFQASLSNIATTTYTGIANAICSNYAVGSIASVRDGSTIGIALNSTGYIYVRDNNYTSADDFKTAMNGVQLVYELATPYTVQLTPTQVACLLGQNNVWNNISNTSVTYPTNHSYQSLSTTHKYYKRINGVESISVGSDMVVDVGTDNIIDLTQMFGTTIADYIYNIEQSSSSGMGVKFFKSLFPSDDYDYNSGELISVKASAHVIKDANGNVVHTYPLDSDLVLRGMPKLDANNKLYYDGDVYEPDGSVTRKYGIVDLGTLNWVYSSADTIFYVRIDDSKYYTTVQDYNKGVVSKALSIVAKSRANLVDKEIILGTGYVGGGKGTAIVRDSTFNGDKDAFKSAMSGVYLVYELATPTTEQADPFEENQTIIPNGIEEYTVTEQGDVEMPVGHDSTYYATEIYGGTIDMASGVLTINMVSVDLGSLTWSAGGTSDANAKRMFADIPNAKVSATTSSVPNIFCPIYESISPNGTYSKVEGITIDTVNSRVWVYDSRYNTTSDVAAFKSAMNGVQLVYELATPIEISLTPQQMQTLSGQNNIWSNTNGGMYLVYKPPITSLLVKRRDVADVSGKWLTLYSTPITQASDMDFTFIDFLNQYGKTYQYALVPVLAQNQSGVIVQIEGGYTVSDNVDSIFDGVYIADQTNVERVKAGVGYGNIDMNQGVGSITPIGSKYPIVITNSQNQYHNGSIRGTIVPNDFYSNGNLSRIDMVNKRDELEQFLTNKRAKIIKDWNGKMWLVMIMDNIDCSFDNNYGMGIVTFNANWLEVGDPTNQEDLQATGLVDVGGV